MSVIGLTRILTGHALMFEQDRLQGRINQLFERIERSCVRYCVKRMREGEGYTTDETLLASQLLAFCEGMLSRFVRSGLNTARRMILTPAGR